MTKNKFKPSDFKYEPIKQKKQPFYLHSVQTYRTARTTAADVIAIVAIFAAIAIIWGVLA